MTFEIENLEQWNDLISIAISSVAEGSFPSNLEAALRQLVDFDICMIFSYSQTEESTALYHNMEDEIARVVVGDYLAGPYLLDPFYGAVVSGKRAGFGSMRMLAPDHFTRSEFYRHHYVRTGIADEMGLFFQVAENRTAVLSVTRQKPKRFFNKNECRMFASAAPILEKIAATHWKKKKRSIAPTKIEFSIERAFSNFGAGVVTAREQDIIVLILKGHSSESISHLLGISSGTVKIHRKNAYYKLNISSQAQLFSLFLSNLEQSLFS
ncbi:MAG: helix-turn-helix transcriptional regulator [Salaquimonas sp.]